MIVLTKRQDVLTCIRQMNAAVIGVDGAMGSGKTTLAKWLATELQGNHIEVDRFLVIDQKAYVEHVDCHALADRIAASSRPIIVEGVCLLTVADKCGLKFDITVYLKEINNHGHWIYQEEVRP